jgi:predicted phosphate transport protein (TIGR00153 family)
MDRSADGDFGRQVDDAVLVIFGLVTESIGWATAALLEQDVERAEALIAQDRDIDQRCEAVIGLIRERLSDLQRTPDDLDTLIAILQIVPELERSADLAEHIAQRAHRNLGGQLSPRARGLIDQMSEIAVRMWQIAGSAYEERSRSAGFELTDADDELDEMASHLVSDIVLGDVDSPIAAELALIGRFYERLGDHAVNLARRVDIMAAPRRLSGLQQAPRQRSVAPKAQRGLRRAFGRVRRMTLLPTDDGFFELFVAAAENARECAEDLRKLVASFNAFDEHFDRIRARERRGDEITSDLLRRLHISLAPPYDREDMHALIEELDNVVDDMFAAASLMQVFHIREALPELSEQADVLVTMTDELVELMVCLKARSGARYRLERIEHLERQGDNIYERSVGRLFSGAYDALDVLKWKDIVQALEEALNSIEDVSDVVESMLVKSS